MRLKPLLKKRVGRYPLNKMHKRTKDKLLNVVKNNYKKIAQDFNITRHKEIWPELRKLAEAVKNGEKVLDVGCGNGRLLETFKEKQIDYLGVDNNEELINLARDNYSKEFLIGDILNLHNIQDHHFDHIFCLAVLQHIPSKELRVQALQELKKKLKQNGHIIISNWNLWQGKHRKIIYKFYLKKLLRQNKMDWGDIIFPWKNSQGEKISDRYYHAFSKRELRKLVKKVGLDIFDLYKDKYNYWLILKQKK